MKKLTALLLVLVMIFSLAACAKTENTSKKEEPTQEEVVNAYQKKDEPAPEQKTEEKTEQTTEEKKDEPTTPPEPEIPQWQIDHPGWLCEDKVTLTVATYEDSATGYVKPGDDVRFWQWLEDYTNVHIDWTIWDYTDWKTNSNTMIATGEITDIFRTGGTDICDTCGENGLALDMLPYLLDGCFDKTLAAMENKGMSRTEYLSKFTNSLKGKMYGYGCYGGTQHYNRQCLFYNAHILEQLEGEFEYGIDKTPKSVEEFYEYCKKIKALGDYNGNGIDDEVVVLCSGPNTLLRAFLNAYGLEGNAPYFATDPETGKIYNELTTEGFREAMRWFQKFYAEGLFDPDMFNITVAMMREKLANQQVGVYQYYASFAGGSFNTYCADYVGNEKEQHWAFGYPLSVPELGTGNVFYEDGTGNGYGTIVSAKCAYPEIACRWLDTLCCDETVNVVRWLGFEGEQWEYDKDGNRVILPGGNDSTTKKEMGLGQITLPHLQSTNGDGLVNTELDWFMHEQNELLEKAEYRLLTSVSTAWYTSDEKAMTNKYSGDFTTHWNEMKVKFMTGELNMDEDWDAFVKDMQDNWGMMELCMAYEHVRERLANFAAALDAQ